MPGHVDLPVDVDWADWVLEVFLGGGSTVDVQGDPVPVHTEVKFVPVTVENALQRSN